MAVEVLRADRGGSLRPYAAGEVAVRHRSGTLSIGEVAVAIAACAPHRSAAFDATRYVIEQIKTRLPIWKREEYEDGSSRWLDGSQCHRAPADRVGSRGEDRTHEGRSEGRSITCGSR